MSLIAIAGNTVECNNSIDELAKLFLQNDSIHIIEPIKNTTSKTSEEQMVYVLDRLHNHSTNEFTFIFKNTSTPTKLYVNDIANPISVKLVEVLGLTASITEPKLVFNAISSNIYKFGCIIEGNISTISMPVLYNAVSTLVSGIDGESRWYMNEHGWWRKLSKSNVIYINQAMDHAYPRMYLGYHYDKINVEADHDALRANKPFPNRLFYHDANGYVVTNQFVAIPSIENPSYYYYAGDTGRLVDGWNLINNYWYHFEDNCMASSTTMIDGIEYRLLDDGKLNFPSANFTLDNLGVLHKNV